MQDVATLDGTYGIPSVSAANGHVVIALSRYLPSDPDTPGTMLIKGDEAGNWQAPSVPSGFTAADTQANVVQGAAGRLTIAYEHCVGPSSGGVINTIKRVGDSWASPKPQTAQRYSSVTAVALKSGHPVVQYLTSHSAVGTFCRDGGPYFHDGPPS